MVTLKVRGQTGRTEAFLRKHMKLDIEDLEQYGVRGVNALAEATPMDTGVTAASWDYIIRKEDNYEGIVWVNNNVVDGDVNIAAILQYGHATGNGGYVPGIDYINPALKMIFEEVTDDVWNKIAEESVEKFDKFLDTFADTYAEKLAMTAWSISMPLNFIPGLNKTNFVQTFGKTANYKAMDPKTLKLTTVTSHNSDKIKSVLNADVKAYAKKAAAKAKATMKTDAKTYTKDIIAKIKKTK